MKALVYHGPSQRGWDTVADPTIIDPTDIVVRIDTSTICGSDLHILRGDVPETTPGTGAVAIEHLTPSLAVAAPLASVALPIRVVLAGSHALMRRSLRLLLDGEDDVEVVGEADDLASVVRHVEGDQPQVLLLDLSMPGGSSVEAINQLRERVPATQVVALTMEDDPVFAQRAFAAGAVGFVMTERSDAELLQAIRSAARGEEYISPQVAPRLDAIHRSLTEDKLTSREVKVLRLIAHGHTSVEIARKLRISSRTVETHRSRILSKLSLATRAELVHYALGRGLLRT